MYNRLKLLYLLFFLCNIFAKIHVILIEKLKTKELQLLAIFFIIFNPQYYLSRKIDLLTYV